MTIALYMRLSKEDDVIREESNSISMQRILLRDYVREHFPNEQVEEFSDDGYSGTDFKRPGIQALLNEVKNGEIKCIIVKDFSRFGRDYIELGSYLEQIFPFMGVRFISINDKYDSDKYAGNVADLDTNFKNLLYDLYSKDLSVKIKASLRSIKEQGNFVAVEAPLGYWKDPADRHKLLIAEDEAAIVRRIFSMRVEGMSTVEIAKELNSERVKTFAQIRIEKGLRKTMPKTGRFVWMHSTIRRILTNRVYVGDLVQCRRESKEIHGSRKATSPDKWVITENHHEPIINRKTFDQVQKKFGKKRGPWKKKDTHVLSGRLKCGGCGKTLSHCSNRKYPYYWCNGVNIYHLDGCVRRVDDSYLEEMILYQLQQHIMELKKSDQIFLAEKLKAEQEKGRLAKECEAIKREIEKIRKKRMDAFEVYALGKVESYDGSKLSEQEERLRSRHEVLLKQLSLAKDEARKYERMKPHEGFAVTKLTPELMDRYIESVVVGSEKGIRIRWKKAE